MANIRIGKKGSILWERRKRGLNKLVGDRSGNGRMKQLPQTRENTKLWSYEWKVPGNKAT